MNALFFGSLATLNIFWMIYAGTGNCVISQTNFLSRQITSNIPSVFCVAMLLFVHCFCELRPSEYKDYAKLETKCYEIVFMLNHAFEVKIQYIWFLHINFIFFTLYKYTNILQSNNYNFWYPTVKKKAKIQNFTNNNFSS